MINTVSDFINKIVGYFGAFQNDIVQDMFAAELAKVKPSDYDKLFRNIITHYPATWHPDVKAVFDAVTALHLNLLEPVSSYKCPVCGETGTMISGCCVVCKYSPTSDGDPNKYREWWKRWQAGEEPVCKLSGLRIGTHLKNEKR